MNTTNGQQIVCPNLTPTEIRHLMGIRDGDSEFVYKGNGQLLKYGLIYHESTSGSQTDPCYKYAITWAGELWLAIQEEK